MKYPNLHKKQKIEALEEDAMRLEDDSVWRIVKDASLPSQEVLNVGDKVVIEPMGPTRPGDEIKSYKVVKDPRKQGFKVSWVNEADFNTKKPEEYDVEKKRKGTINDGRASEIKQGEGYPDEWLGKDCRIIEIRKSDDIKDWRIKDYSGGDCIIVADSSQYGSGWELLQFSTGSIDGWQSGAKVRISKRKSGMTMYWIENTDIPESQPVGVRFAGWAKSKF